MGIEKSRLGKEQLIEIATMLTEQSIVKEIYDREGAFYKASMVSEQLIVKGFFIVSFGQVSVGKPLKSFAPSP